MPVDPITGSAIATWLAPYLKDLAARGLMYLGGRAIGGALGSPEQKRYQEQLAMVSRLQPDYLALLRKQMQGQPTAATEAIRRQVRQEGRAAQQALATSASRAGQGGAEVARAQQARLAAAETQQLMQELGRAQREAMAQVGQLTGAARREQALLAQQEASDISEIARFLMMGLGDAETRELMNEILREIRLRRYNPGYEQLGPGFRPEDVAALGQQLNLPVDEWVGIQRPASGRLPPGRALSQSEKYPLSVKVTPRLSSGSLKQERVELPD